MSSFEQLAKERKELKNDLMNAANKEDHDKLLTAYLTVNQSMVEAAHSEKKFHLLSKEYNL